MRLCAVSCIYSALFPVYLIKFVSLFNQALEKANARGGSTKHPAVLFHTLRSTLCEAHAALEGLDLTLDAVGLEQHRGQREGEHEVRIYMAILPDEGRPEEQRCPSH